MALITSDVHHAIWTPITLLQDTWNKKESSAMVIDGH